MAGKVIRLLLVTALLLGLIVVPLGAQNEQVPPVVLGRVLSVDTTNQVVYMRPRTDAPRPAVEDTVVVNTDSNTLVVEVFGRVPAEESTIIAFADIGRGDSLYVIGRPQTDGSLLASSMVVRRWPDRRHIL